MSGDCRSSPALDSARRVIRALTHLLMPDALLTASALLSGAEAVISNDRDWYLRLRGHFTQFRWIYLAD